MPRPLSLLLYLLLLVPPLALAAQTDRCDTPGPAGIDDRHPLDPSCVVVIRFGSDTLRTLHEPGGATPGTFDIGASGLLAVDFDRTRMLDRWDSGLAARISMRARVVRRDSGSQAVEVPGYSVIGDEERTYALDVKSATHALHLLQQGSRFAHRILDYHTQAEIAGLRARLRTTTGRQERFEAYTAELGRILVEAYDRALTYTLVTGDIERGAAALARAEEELGELESASDIGARARTKTFFGLLQTQVTSIDAWLDDIDDEDNRQILSITAGIVGRSPSLIQANVRDMRSALDRFDSGELTGEAQAALMSKLAVLARQMVSVERDLFRHYRQLPATTRDSLMALPQIRAGLPDALQGMPPGRRQTSQDAPLSGLVYFADDAALQVRRQAEGEGLACAASLTLSARQGGGQDRGQDGSGDRAGTGTGIPDRDGTGDGAAPGTGDGQGDGAGSDGDAGAATAGDPATTPDSLAQATTKRFLEELRQRSGKDTSGAPTDVLEAHFRSLLEKVEKAKRKAKELGVRLTSLERARAAGQRAWTICGDRYNESISAIELLLLNDVMTALVQRIPPTYIDVSQHGLEPGDRLVVEVSTIPGANGAPGGAGQRPFVFEVVPTGWSGPFPRIAETGIFARAFAGERDASFRPGAAAVWDFYGESGFLRTLGLSVGIATTFLDFETRRELAPDSVLTEDDAALELGIGPVIGLFNGVLSFTIGANLQETARLITNAGTDAEDTESSRWYWGIGVSLSPVFERF